MEIVKRKDPFGRRESQRPFIAGMVALGVGLTLLAVYFSSSGRRRTEDGPFQSSPLAQVPLSPEAPMSGLFQPQSRPAAGEEPAEEARRNGETERGLEPPRDPLEDDEEDDGAPLGATQAHAERSKTEREDARGDFQAISGFGRSEPVSASSSGRPDAEPAGAAAASKQVALLPVSGGRSAGAAGRRSDTSAGRMDRGGGRRGAAGGTQQTAAPGAGQSGTSFGALSPQSPSVASAGAPQAAGPGGRAAEGPGGPSGGGLGGAGEGGGVGGSDGGRGSDEENEPDPASFEDFILAVDEFTRQPALVQGRGYARCVAGAYRLRYGQALEHVNSVKARVQKETLDSVSENLGQAVTLLTRSVECLPQDLRNEALESCYFYAEGPLAGRRDLIQGIDLSASQIQQDWSIPQGDADSYVANLNQAKERIGSLDWGNEADAANLAGPFFLARDRVLGAMSQLVRSDSFRNLPERNRFHLDGILSSARSRLDLASRAWAKLPSEPDQHAKLLRFLEAERETGMAANHLITATEHLSGVPGAAPGTSPAPQLVPAPEVALSQCDKPPPPPPPGGK